MFQMSAAHRWSVLLSGLLIFILVPFIALEGTVHEAFNDAVQAELHPVWLAGLIALLLASDLVLPVPSSVASTAAGAALGFEAGTLTIWVGMSLGCLIGYWLGAFASTLGVRRLLGKEELEKAQRLVCRYGVMALVITRAVPVLAEASVIVAGLTRVPLRSFLIVTGLANLGVSAVYAGVGAFASAIDSFLLAFGGAILVPVATIVIARSLYRGTHPLPLTFGAPHSAETHSTIIEQRFSVAFDYPVYFTHSVFDPDNHVFVQVVSRQEPTRHHSLTVFVDDGVAAAWRNLTPEIEAYVEVNKDRLRLTTSPIKVAGGERCKNDPEILRMLYRQLLELGVDRHSFVVAIGGGAVLDAVGYAAATFHRGVRLVRLPTTVLAQNDSGVSVKTGINLFGTKNSVGVFAPPYGVINDFCFLETLSPRDRCSGIAEAVKVALIRDRHFFEWLETHLHALTKFEPHATSYMVRRCAELHMHQIAHGGDPFESGSVRPLDYGHWSAHKLESLTEHELRHGEAVAIGMALDARYAVQTGLLQAGTEERICRLLEGLGFQLWHPALATRCGGGRPTTLDGLREFREHLGGDLTVTLLNEIGVGVEVHEVKEDQIVLAMNWLRSRDTVHAASGN